MPKQSLLRNLPAVDELLRTPELRKLQETVARNLVKSAVRETLDRVRREILEASQGHEPDVRKEDLIRDVVDRAVRKTRHHFRRAVNATGVVVHTNLGRSLLAQSALEQVLDLSGHYSNLEFDLEAGKRGSRYSHVTELLQELTGAEAALVVNNNAAAVFLVLETLAKGYEVIVSRGELVEIGGSFRIPDVMARSGAVMVEVGTTNKTHFRDYQAAITDQTRLLLKVHRSNFQIIGFTEEVSLPELKALGTEHGIPVMEDLGSGCFVDFSKFGLRYEPTVQDTLAGGASVVTFSGDKLLGGPQAGIILGRREIVEQVQRNPLNRVVRIDKMTLAALEATLLLYREEELALRHIPTLAMIGTPLRTLNGRAQRLRRRMEKALPPGTVDLSVVPGSSRVGGGALPEMDLPTRLVSVTPRQGLSAARIEERLRRLPLPVICRIEQDRLLLDVRTILESELEAVCRAFAAVLGPQEP